MNKAKIYRSLNRIYNGGPMRNMTSFSNYIGTYLNPDNIGVKVYQEMFDFDFQCRSGIQYVTLACLARLGNYSHSKPEITEFINSEFERIYGSIRIMLEEMISTALMAGFSVGELVFDVQSDAVHLSDIQFLNPANIAFDLDVDSTSLQKNRVKAIKQYGGLLGTIDSETPPIEKFVVFSVDGQYGNPYGKSRLKAAYPLYYMKKGIIVFWAQALERFGAPFITVKILSDTSPPPETVDDGTGNLVSPMEFLKNALDTMVNGTGIISPEWADIKSELASGSFGNNFKDAVQYCDKGIYQALLLPGLTGQTDTNGNRSLGETHFDLFTLALDQLRECVCDTVIDQIIRRLITWNFGEQDEWGSFEYERYDHQTAKTLMEIFSGAINAGIMDVSRFEDLRHGREKLGLPPVSDDDFRRMQTEAKTEVRKSPTEPDKKSPQEKTQQDPEQFSTFGKHMGNLLNGVPSLFTEV